MSTPSSLPKRTHRWFQYSLRTLLVVVTLCAIPGSWLGVELQRARRQREAVAAIETIGGKCFMIGKCNAMGDELPNAQPPGSTSFRRILGEDFFQSGPKGPS